MSEILTSVTSGLARITLNRPEALHALTTHMCRNIIQALLAWRDDDSVRAVLIDHAQGTRGFCAGGDIRMLAESGKGDGKAAREFFFTEYQMNHLLFTYPKPVIAIMDGVTMGGGVGVSMPATFRIATENTTYAMPETGIGLFPDVGGGWYLPRKPGQVGMWLALTGARLKAADCVIAGVATHYVEAGKLEALVAELSSSAASGGEAEIARVIEGFASDPGAPRELTSETLDRINHFFALGSVEQIFAALDSDPSDWSKAQLKTLHTKSPQTLKVAFRQLREGALMKSFDDEMRQEYRIACRVVQRRDFLEGVRALIVEKDNKPAWAPSTLSAVTDAMLDEIFAPLPQREEWSPLGK
jgi:enoyl-CoA hydratase